MTPRELRELLLSGSPTEETYAKLPSEAGGIWFSRPTREHIERGKHFMYFRSTLIAAVTVYLLFFHRDIGEAQVLPWIIVSYEFAYYTLRKEKNELDYLLAQERYAQRVDELLQRVYPGWKPEQQT